MVPSAWTPLLSPLPGHLWYELQTLCQEGWEVGSGPGWTAVGGGLTVLPFPAMQSLPPSLGPCVDGQARGGQTPMPFALLVDLANLFSRCWCGIL